MGVYTHMHVYCKLVCLARRHLHGACAVVSTTQLVTLLHACLHSVQPTSCERKAVYFVLHACTAVPVVHQVDLRPCLATAQAAINGGRKGKQRTPGRPGWRLDATVALSGHFYMPLPSHTPGTPAHTSRAGSSTGQG
jgi:hypothetical protein